MNGDNIRTSCIRCGQCCIKGGPTLHQEDVCLLNDGVLQPGDLFTIRAGEPIRDPVKGIIVQTPIELVKIKGVPGSWACKFFDPAAKACNIYENRPLECRVLKCWHPEDSIRLFMHDVLSRSAVIPEGSFLYEVISSYEARFSAAAFIELFTSTIPLGGSAALYKIDEKIDLDNTFRREFIEFFGIEATVMDFFFGRPLKDIAAPLMKKTLKGGYP
ncbi:MAG: YkgJ family cysteine cluster protein [Dissulfurimicrobium sp.]|uniref:YkgJ family cysteine cluster protein n=1 Tax=Dissulfurimicrobium TaxID=1769732 RepID=UPI001EDBFF9B|nr:YkgJ family cysteine cluster protein [Dissulfurimicrobium hydrothermale]UKL13876.1 YkgJ family cysteine cluster protein [Dissulfurimicrobium hydrothermale]